MAINTRTVPAHDADTRLDRWLRRYYPQLTQGALQKMLRTGQIRVDGKRAEANTRLLGGQEIRIPPMPEGQAPKALPKPVNERDAKDIQRLVIYRDDAVIALDKPHGLAVQGGPGIAKHIDGLLDALRFDSEERPRLVHRLDRDTSGVLVLARTGAAAAKLAAAFRSRAAEKTYWAVVVGRPTGFEGRIDLALSKQGGPKGERVAEDKEECALAITFCRLVDSAQRRSSFVEITPRTGRTHQLRVHCTEGLKCPILGDGKYGGAGAFMEGLPNMLHLHARALRLPHPDGGTLELAAPLPPHMDETFLFLGFDRPKPPPCRRLR